MKSQTLCLALFALIVAVVIGVPGAQAQGTVPTAITAPAPAAPEMSQAGGPLTPDEIRTMLENMGYEPKPQKDDKGEVYGYAIRIEGERYTYTMNIGLSPSKKVVWLTVNLKSLPDPKVPQQVLMGILRANENWGTVILGYLESANMLQVKSHLLNRGLRVADLRARIQDVGKMMVGTGEIWDPDRWTSSKPSPGPVAKP
jgi:hypothetical protein